MFKKIDIQKFGLFEDFAWSRELNDYPFNRVNIIYGRNYSGKTTLSRIFNSISKGELPERKSQKENYEKDLHHYNALCERINVENEIVFN